MTNPPGHLWRDKWTALNGPLSRRFNVTEEVEDDLIPVWKSEFYLDIVDEVLPLSLP